MAKRKYPAGTMVKVKEFEYSDEYQAGMIPRMHEYLKANNYYVPTTHSFDEGDPVFISPNNTHEVYIREIAEPFIMSRRYATKLKSVLSI